MDMMVHPRLRRRVPQSAEPPIKVCFLYIAQAHQVLHSLSAAADLALGGPDVAVTVAATSATVLDYARRLAERLGRPPIQWRLLGPGWLRGASGPDGVPPKLPMLAANARFLNGFDAIVAPERTTTALRRMGVSHPKLVYTQHGAGDRGGVFEPRLGRFDLVFSAGAKQRDRMIAEGLVTPAQCAVIGYPKFDLVDRLDQTGPNLFAVNRPIVLYNPHFTSRVSSWPQWGQKVLQAFANQDRYNLIFAPHLRLFRGRAAQDVIELTPFLGVPSIHLDLGTTPAAIEMTYTRLADVYLGDASSQIYEFLLRPRPCVFLNANSANWREDESHRHWRYGPVVDEIGDVVRKVDEAVATHSQYLAAQEDGFSLTFDLAGPTSSSRAASAIRQVASQEA